MRHWHGFLIEWGWMEFNGALVQASGQTKRIQNGPSRILDSDFRILIPEFFSVTELACRDT
jgi:hypothetical protein